MCPRCAARAEAKRRDLLANRSRVPLRADWEFAGIGGDADVVLSRLATAIAAAEPTAAFWSYTNTGWGMLGRALETAHEPVEPWTPVALRPAGGTVLSTVNDTLRFARAHLEDDHLATLRVPHSDVAIHAWFDSWCLGWAQFDHHARHIYGWDGLLPGQRSVLRLDPEHASAAVLLTNDDDGRALYRSLFEELLDIAPLAIEPRPVRRVSSRATPASTRGPTAAGTSARATPAYVSSTAGRRSSPSRSTSARFSSTRTTTTFRP